VKFDVLGVPVDALDLDSAVDDITVRIDSGQRGYVCVTGVHGVMEAGRRPMVAAAHRGAALVVPDGMPLVWCGRRLGLQIGRVYGPDLMLKLLEAGVPRGWRHALYGSSEAVLSDLRRRFEQRFPGVCIAGTISPPYGALPEGLGRQHADRLNAMGPDVVWVGLSTPKQELWMHRWRPHLEAPLLIGVGAAFDFHAGTVPQAPPVLQRHGLEWAYRLRREPKRLWRRYLRNNPAFALGIVRRRPRLLSPAP
jgi:N-acetylglucosaminyldiphosphoundecaprenol N-acetyl-beta-D-mannosaminyltransferase